MAQQPMVSDWVADQLDAALASDDYRSLALDRDAYARLAAKSLHEGDVDAARVFAASAQAAVERIDRLFVARQLRRDPQVTFDLAGRDV